MESKLWWLVLSAVVVLTAATSINRLNQDDFDPNDDFEGHDDFDTFDEDRDLDSTNVTQYGERKGKICKSYYFIKYVMVMLLEFYCFNSRYT